MSAAKLASVLVILVLILTGTTHAQNRYLKDGVSGFALEARYERSENIDGTGAAVTFTIDGRYDIGFSLGRTNIEDDGYSEDLRIDGIGPHGAVALIRPRDGVPLGAEIFGSYQTGSYEGETLRNNEWDMSGYVLAGGIDAWTRLGYATTFAVYPAISLAYAWEVTELCDKDCGKTSATIEGRVLSANLGIQIARALILNPRFTDFQDSDRWSISASWLVSFE
jgi:hypothetical protein